MRAVDGVSLQIGQGEVFSLLGPSGCGKTTLLRMLAGFEQPDNGRIILNGKDITDLPPECRPVNTVFQNYALFPHLSVFENIAFGLRIAKKSKSDIRTAVECMLHLVKLESHANKRPAQLSGGQRQRVAIARALVNGPQLLLLDEPLAALDLKLRQHMLSELTAIHKEVGATFIYVTHDQGEAMGLSDRIAVMNAGKVEQVATPPELYLKPANSFVASFIGDTNLFEGRVEEGLPDHLIRVSIEDIGSTLIKTDAQVLPGSFVQLSVRPERLHISAEKPVDDEGNHVFPAIIEEGIYLGSTTRYRLRAGKQKVLVQRQVDFTSAGAIHLKPDTQVWVGFNPATVHVLPASVS